MSDPVREAVRLALADGVVARDRPLVVGVSGGPDSTALLLALLAEGVPVVAAHLNHGLRTEESDRDEAWVRALAAARGVPLVVGRPASAPEDRNVEAWARRERYAFLGRVAAAAGAPTIVVGHTADDQLETLLLRLLRGAGPAGLGGMAPVTRLDRLTGVEVRVVRPLLSVRRAATLAYCRAHGVEPLVDTSNASGRFLRNRLRREVVPVLVRENPRLVEDVAGMLALLRDQQAFVRAEVERRWVEVARPDDDGLRADVLATWPPALASEALRLLAERVVGPPSPLERHHVSRVLDLTRAGMQRRIQLPGGLEAVVDATSVRVQRRRPAPPVPAPVLLEVPGEARFGPWQLRAERRVAWDVRRTSGPAGAWARSAGPFLVRSRRPGDRYRPLGGRGTVRVQNELVNRKVPREERDLLPLLVEEERLVWLVGSRVAEDQAVSEGEEATWLEAHREA